jgi:hypothetical protein
VTIKAQSAIEGLREVVRATRQANHIVRFDHVTWITARLYDLVREIDAIELAGAPIERYIEAQQTLLANMDAIMARMKGPMFEEIERLHKQIALRDARIAQLEGERHVVSGANSETFP